MGRSRWTGRAGPDPAAREASGRPRSHPGVQTLSQEGSSDGNPGLNGAPGNRGPRRCLEPLGACHPVPPSPGTLSPSRPRWHLRGGWSRGRALRGRGCSALRGRSEGARFTQSVLGCQPYPESAPGLSPPSAASWLRLRRRRYLFALPPATASLGRRPPSPPSPRSNRDPPARAPGKGQHGGRDAPNLRVFALSVQGQHHDTTAAPHCHFRRRRGKKKAIPSKTGGGVGANRAGADARREHEQGRAGQQGLLATFWPHLPPPRGSQIPQPLLWRRFTCFLLRQE